MAAVGPLLALAVLLPAAVLLTACSDEGTRPSPSGSAGVLPTAADDGGTAAEPGTTAGPGADRDSPGAGGGGEEGPAGSPTTAPIPAVPDVPPGLPENFPPLELPPGSRVLDTSVQEVGDGRLLSETAFDAAASAAEQYRHFLAVFEEQGYAVLEHEIVEGESMSAYLIVATYSDLAVTVTGGRGAVGEQSPALTQAEHPFVVAVGPAG